MIKFLDIIEVYTLHAAILAKSKGKGGIRDFSLLHSAVERPKATFGGKSLYPTLFVQAAALLQSLCLNHAFTDGNKRSAWGATKRFLWINGYNLITKRMEGANFMVHVDNDKPDLPEIASWLKDHCTKR
jgi:death on curing protein